MSDTLKDHTLERDAVFAGKVVPAGTSVQATDAALQAAYSDGDKLRTRAAIASGVGDTDSIVGTANDTAQFLLVEFTSLVTRIASAKNMEEVKAAAKVSADKLSSLHAAVKDGEVVFPFQAKGGEAAVLQEIADKATAVSSAIKGETVSKDLSVLSPAEDISREQAPEPYTPLS